MQNGSWEFGTPAFSAQCFRHVRDIKEKLQLTWDQLYSEVNEQATERGLPKTQRDKLVKSADHLKKLVNDTRSVPKDFVQLLDLCAEIFARRTAAFGKNKQDYLNYIFQHDPDRRSDEPNSAIEQAPSFLELFPGHRSDGNPSRFFDAHPPTMADIAADLDVIRTVYSKTDEGIRDTIINWLSRETSLFVASLSGTSGSGKTVISMRLAHDCLQAGFRVFRLRPDWSSADSLSIQIRRVATNSDSPALFLLDDAGSLYRGDVRILDLVESIRDIPKPSAVLFIENWRLFTTVDLSSYDESQSWSTGPFTKHEAESLVDRLLNLEQTNAFQQIRCTLPRQARLAKLESPTERLPAVALPILRYGEKIDAILEREFQSIDSPEVQYAYSVLVLFAGLRAPVPTTILNRLNNSPPMKFWETLEAVSARIGNTLSIRHPVLYSYLSQITLGTPDDRVAQLIHVVSAADPSRDSDARFLKAIFTTPGCERRISQLLNKDSAASAEIISQLDGLIRDRDYSEAESEILAFMGMQLMNISFDFTAAYEMFNRAVSRQPSYSFAHRQKAWNRFRAGELEDAAADAIQAIDQCPTNAKVLSDCAWIMSCCTLEGFKSAKDHYLESLKLDPGDKTTKSRLERHQEALDIFYSDEELPHYVLNSLRAPWYVWRVRSGTNSKDFRRALHGALGSRLRSQSVNLEEIEEIEAAAGKKRDKLLSALLKGNLARADYQQWYHHKTEIDFDKVENLFLSALKSLPDEPFIRTWYGTFLKEVRSDFDSAEQQYRQAIDSAKQSRLEHARNHPMLLNNLALLLLYCVDTSREELDALNEATSLVQSAIEENEGRNLEFEWVYDTRDQIALARSDRAKPPEPE